MNWAKFNDATIIEIKSLCIKRCSKSSYCARKTKMRNDVEHLSWSQSSRNWIHTNVQSIIAQCASIEFLLLLHYWISFNSYYNWHHKSIATYVIANYWIASATIASTQCSIREDAKRCRASQLVATNSRNWVY